MSGKGGVLGSCPFSKNCINTLTMSGGEESLLSHETVLYCALFPQNHEIRRKELIEHLIDEEIIDKKDSRRAEFQIGHHILTKLVAGGRLVEGCVDHKGLQCVKMRDDDRERAIQTLIEGHGTLVEAGVHLKELPGVERWSKKLVRVSLMHNDILEVPSSHTGVECSDLSTLLLGNNLELKGIAHGFLGKFEKLKVLDLSMTKVDTLPEDVGSLKNLTALLLCGCEQLSCVPSLGNLESLKKLDLKSTGLKNMPGGVEKLRSLKYLDISMNQIEEIPSETLFKLTCLQVLKLNEIGTARPITVQGAEVGSLRNLETLRCNFKNLSDFSKYWNHKEGSKELLSEYSFLIGDVFWPDEFDINHFSQSTKRVGMFNCRRENEEENVYLPTGVQMLLLEKCHELKDLDNLPALKSATELSDLFLFECKEIVCLIPSSWFSEGTLRSLQYLQLVALEKLTDLVVRRSDSSSPIVSLPTDSTFSQLTRIEVVSCDVMKKLLPRSLVPCLKNLEAITVEHCDIMEEIFATDEEGSEVSSCRSYCQSHYLILPKLKTLVLNNLPKLTSICKEVLRCPLIEIELVECGPIERFHIKASTTDPWTYQSSLGVIKASYPRESREPMECGDSNYSRNEVFMRKM